MKINVQIKSNKNNIHIVHTIWFNYIKFDPKDSTYYMIWIFIWSQIRIKRSKKLQNAFCNNCIPAQVTQTTPKFCILRFQMRSDHVKKHGLFKIPPIFIRHTNCLIRLGGSGTLLDQRLKDFSSTRNFAFKERIVGKSQQSRAFGSQTCWTDSFSPYLFLPNKSKKRFNRERNQKRANPTLERDYTWIYVIRETRTRNVREGYM